MNTQKELNREDTNEEPIVQLNDLDLVLVGGGIGDTAV